PGFGCDDEPIRVGRQCLANEALACLIGCGRVDEVHTKVDRAAEYALARLGVWRITPNTRSGDPHRPVPHSIDGEIADSEGSRAGCRRHSGRLSRRLCTTGSWSRRSDRTEVSASLDRGSVEE